MEQLEPIPNGYGMLIPPHVSSQPRFARDDDDGDDAILGALASHRITEIVRNTSLLFHLSLSVSSNLFICFVEKEIRK